MKTKITVGIVVLFIVGIIAAAAINGGSKAPADSLGPTSAGSETLNPNASSTKQTVPVTTPVSAEKSYTLAQVSAHKDATSCWTAINGGVYDVTSWIDQHPGGREAILSICGKDGTSAFTNQHGGQARPAAELASFKIGVLAK
jgi:cytochrome b involved in lipid metabolism